MTPIKLGFDTKSLAIGIIDTLCVRMGGRAQQLNSQRLHARKMAYFPIL